jgi:sec-independent protein translocase protein TatA
MPGLPSIGLPELLILLVIILIIFGAGKLPEIARGLGEAIGDFRRASQGLDLEEQLEEKKTED